MNDGRRLSDREYYETLPLEELGGGGCCKIFCNEYRRIVPEAELWGVKRKDKTLSHVFILNHGVAYDVRGGRKKEEMAESSTKFVTRISEAEFNAYHTFVDGEVVLREVAAERFHALLLAEPFKYGLR